MAEKGVLWYKKASNGMELTVQNTGSQTNSGLLEITSPNVPVRRLLFSTPEVAEGIAKIMFVDFDGKHELGFVEEDNWITVFID